MESQQQPQNIIIGVLVLIVIVFGILTGSYFFQEDKPEEEKRLGLGIIVTTVIIGFILILLTLWVLVPDLRKFLILAFQFLPFLIIIVGAILSYTLLLSESDKETLNTIQKRAGISLGIASVTLFITFGLLFSLVRIDPANTYYPFLFAMIALNSLVSTTALSATVLGKSL